MHFKTEKAYVQEIAGGAFRGRPLFNYRISEISPLFKSWKMSSRYFKMSMQRQVRFVSHSSLLKQNLSGLWWSWLNFYGITIIGHIPLKFKMSLLGPFIFTKVNIKKRPTTQSAHLLQLGLMPLNSAVLLIQIISSKII